MSVYADTNFITLLLLKGEYGPDAGEWMEEQRPNFPVTWLTRLEVINSLEQVVLTGYGPERARVSAEFAASCQEQFREDLADGIAMHAVSLDEDALSARFEQIALRHTARHGFRTYDILHVAAALTLRCRHFWSFDRRASKLAKLEGLRVLT